MKTPKLLLSLALLFVANATFASDASVASATVTQSGTTSSIMVISGSNGTFILNTGTSVGTWSNVADVEHVNFIYMDADATHASASVNETCYLTIPEGVTATVSYSASLASSDYVGTAYVKIASTTYNAVTKTSGTVTLDEGTYQLTTYAASTSSSAGQQAWLSVSVEYDE